VKKYLLLILSVLGGIAGVFLRRAQLQHAFEEGSGLPIVGASSTLAIDLFSVLIALLLIFLTVSLGRREGLRLGGAEALEAPSFPYLLCTSSAGLLTAIGGVIYLKSSLLPTQEQNLLHLVFGIFALCAAGSLFLIGQHRFQGKSLEGSLALLLPAYSSCLWLMISYQRWARDPFVTDYMFSLFAIMAGMLAHYFMASYGFGKPQFTPFVVCALLSVYFSMITLADGVSLEEASLLSAQILYFIPTVFVLCSNRGAGDTGPHDGNPDHPLKEETP
jgi:hypothetical protein